MGAYSPLPDLDADAVERVLDTVHRPILAELARRGIAVPRLPVRRPDAHRGRPGPPRVQRPARRPRGAGDPAADRRTARAAAARRRPRPAPGRRRRPASRSCPAPRSASCWRRRAIRATRAGATRSRGSRRRPPRARSCSTPGRSAGRRAASATNGGRVLTVVGRGTTLDAARDAAERAADAIDWDGSSAATTSPADLPAPAGVARMIPRYTLPEMGALWTEQARFERMLEVELAVCRAQARRGLVPPDALAAHRGPGPGRRRRASPRSRRRPTTTSSPS